MKKTNLLTVTLLLMLALVGAGCDTATPTPAAGSPVPLIPPTVTPGGVALLLLPTPVPTQAEFAAPAAGGDVPANILTALPPGLETGAECPPPGNPPPPAPPVAYSLYATTITQFLSDGGAVPFLESILRTWEAITETTGRVTNAYDLTGDGVFDVLAILRDPFNVGINPPPGQLMIFGCHEGGYRLLYSSDYGPGYGIPELLYVGDMTNDTLPEAVFLQRRCQAGACVQAAVVLSWSAQHDGFLLLNGDTIGSPDGTFSIRDLDDDGVLELMISGGGVSTDPALGPPRSSTTIWDWNGLNYVRAATQLDPPVYRIHLIHDADRALEAGAYDEALTLYRSLLENPRLGTWQLENEALMLRGYALYRMLLALIVLQDDAAVQYYRTLVEENAPGTPGDSYLVMADALWRTWQERNDLHQACAATLDAVRLNPQGLLFLNAYGPANRSYAIEDMCPF